LRSFTRLSEKLQLSLNMLSKVLVKSQITLAHDGLITNDKFGFIPRLGELGSDRSFPSNPNHLINGELRHLSKQPTCNSAEVARRIQLDSSTSKHR
jgi:hypothetical protein